MSRTSQALKRLGVAGLAVVTIGAGVPALLGATAQAATPGPVTQVVLTPDAATAPSGTCVTYNARANNAAGQPVDTATVTVSLSEGSAATASGVSATFCDPATGAAVSSSPNSAGQPTAVFAATSANPGVVTFGVVDNAFDATTSSPNNSVIVTAFYDTNGDRVRNGTNEPFDQSTQTTTRKPTQNDVTTVTATPATATNVIGEKHTITATVSGLNQTTTNPNSSSAAPLAGITVSFVVTGVNAQGTQDCNAVTNSIGKTTCSYTGLNTGQDTIRVFVNQTSPTGQTTSNFDPSPGGGASGTGEPNDVVQKQWVAAQTGRTIDVSCLAESDPFLNSEQSEGACTNVLSDPNRTFRAVVTQASSSSTASTTGTLVHFAVTGGSGDETAVVQGGNQTNGGTAADCTTVDNTATTTTTVDSFCDVLITDPTPTAGEVLTVTGTIRGTSATDSATLTFRNVPSDARFISVTPDSGESLTTTARTFTATVTDANGNPVQGVEVCFTETGAGFIRNSNNCPLTDAKGLASIETTTAAQETGDETVTGTITGTQQNANGTGSTAQCSQAAGAGTNPNTGGSVSSTTKAGNCTDTGKTTWVTSLSSPTPSPSSTGTGQPGTQNLTLTLDSPATITPGIQSRMTARGTPNADVILRCYSRSPENANQASPPYFDARGPLSLGASGTLQFVLTPGTNTRCFVKYANTADNASTASASVVQNVATALSLSAYRDGVRKYHFQGTNLPRRAGQLITLYRYATASGGYCVPSPESYTGASNGSCQAIRTATAVTNSTNVWRIDRTFTGSGQFYFVARTSQTLTNVAGFSNQRLTIIH